MSTHQDTITGEFIVYINHSPVLSAASVKEMSDV